MQFSRLTPILQTIDIVATIEFYKNTLDFELDNYDKDWGWCHMHKDDVEIMFSIPKKQCLFENPSAPVHFIFILRG